MGNNIQEYAQMADNTASQITGSYQEWTSFLTTAARLYKYPYHEQLMIYAQRPEATACASYELWNKRMGRYVRRGSKGIALLDMSGDKPRIKYVFDVADTGRTEHSRRFELWEFRQEHEKAVSAMLERRYDVSGERRIEEQFEGVAAQLADEYWNAHQRDILGVVDDSFLYGYDDFNVGVAFRTAATVSVTYSLMSRCGLEPEDYFGHEDFLSVFDWNTPEAVTELGTAVSTINQAVLRQIEITIKQYEREHSAERTEQHEERVDVSGQRGLPDPEHRTEPATDAERGQVRTDAEEVPSGEPAGSLQPPAAVGETASAPAGDRPDGASAVGADDAGIGESGRGDGSPESQRPDEVGGSDEQLQGPGGGDHPERVGVRLTSPEPVPEADSEPSAQTDLFGEHGESGQFSLFPTERQQIQSIEEAESAADAPFASSVSQADIDQILRFGSNTEDSRKRVALEFMKQKSPEKIVAFLKTEYHGGYGIKGADGDMSVWYAEDGIQQFMEELLEPPFYLRRNIRVNFSEYTAEWYISNKSSVGYANINACFIYGTERINAYKILEDTLNLRDVRVYDTKIDVDGSEKRVLNSKETTLAQQKQQAIKDAFQEWVWKEPSRRQALVQKYNELFNSTRPREYDGRHIIFSGMNPEIQLREHQLNAIAHVLYGGNTLLAHEVGSGKTFEMAAAAMESKRLGLCSKSLFVVPNHLTDQWASEFLRLYPSANLLVATKKDFEPRNRKKFCARIATGNYDAVIIGHSQFEKIPMSIERQERLLYEQIEEITDGIAGLKASNAERFTIKQLEKTKKNLEAKLQKLQDSSRKDDVVTFEQLGVDRIFVDEAQYYKNLFLYTKMRNVAGLSTSDAQKSSDMLMKCRYLDEITGGKGVVFATGTPISNSMTELYTMMRYLQHGMLKSSGLTHFDSWASTFGETITAIELAPEGYNF